MKNYSKVEHGGGVLAPQKKKQGNNLLQYLSCLCLLLAIAADAVSAPGIPTLKTTKVLQLGNTGESTLALPSDISVYANKVYVVDGSNHRVMVYDLDGQFLFKFGDQGKRPGQLNYPVGIHAASNHRVYVADSGNHRIQVFSDKGEYLSGFKLKKEIRPIDLIRHSRSGNIIVSASNHRIMTFNPKGKLVRRWGNNGVNEGEFRYPATLSELKDGRIAVVDVLNSRAQVFNPDGSISMVVGEWGILPGQLFRPKGIAIDKHGNFYISDSYLNLVQKYSDSGEFIAVLGSQGKPYDMLTPVGMSVYKNMLYVVEMRKHIVSVFQLTD